MMIQLDCIEESVLSCYVFDDWFVVVILFFNYYLWLVVISKSWVVIISLNLLQKGKDNFTSNAYELRMIEQRKKSCGWF
jgi:hypothetical protein